MSSDPTDTPEFDSALAAARMRILAETFEQSATDGSPLQMGLVRIAVDWLRSAHIWLERHMTPFEVFERDFVLRASDEGIPVTLDTLIDSLRHTAFELLQIQKLLELRTPASSRREPS